ncbi:MAG TPA: hypothetical protein VFD05_00885 [Bacilli bacterium]|nr:hypothetical protein [Bacilli bacterium]
MNLLITTDNFGVFWYPLVQLGFIAALLLLGNTLRRKIPFLRKFLVPTGLIAGFLGLGLKYVFLATDINIDGLRLIDENYMHFVTYHALAIGFIALGFVQSTKPQQKDGRPLKSGFLIVGGYLIQGVVGVLASILLSLVFANYALGQAPYAGILLPMAFGQGPGQAGNIGGTFETLANADGTLAANALVGGRDFGLSLAAFGFIVATIIGTILLNIMNKKGVVKRYGEDEVNKTRELLIVDHEDEIPVVESMDKFTVQVALVLGAYLITFGVLKLLDFLIVDLFGVQALRSILWGFNFLFAILVTVAAKAIIKRLRKRGLMKRRYNNNYMQNRIAGVAFDMMITAGVISINFGKLNDPSMWILFVVLVALGSLTAYIYMLILSKKYFPRTRWYTFFAFFGLLTGTTSEGIALLREIDPYYESRVAEDMVNGAGMAAIFGAPLLVIVMFVTQGPLLMWISFGLLVVLFTIMMLGLHFYTRRKEKELNK